MQEQILHLEYNRVVLVLKALNREPSFELAAKALGIHEQTLQFYKDAYKIYRDKVAQEYKAERWPMIGSIANSNKS